MLPSGLLERGLHSGGQAALLFEVGLLARSRFYVEAREVFDAPLFGHFSICDGAHADSAPFLVLADFSTRFPLGPVSPPKAACRTIPCLCETDDAGRCDERMFYKCHFVKPKFFQYLL